MPKDSLVFRYRGNPKLTSPEARILSLALHTLCTLRCGSLAAQNGVSAERVSQQISAVIAAHTLNLFPNGYDGLMEITLWAESLGLTLADELTPEVKAVIQ